ncbi:hypothetical protein DY000_02049477 [Brassica cretica]|uniref:RNase H type-1 domain-containing protein n=1 Tax=Brassica cretica TaxID=69181 RepID=A0ABQ7EW64_BRACR|nr:hypothetical protein DY000_02049477 [Brassica cretica]
MLTSCPWSSQGLQSWKEATERAKAEQQNMMIRRHIKCAVQDMLPSDSDYYCLVDDASWNSLETMEIGWSLYSREDIHILKGSFSLKPMNFNVEAEIVALSMDVQQMRRLNYDHITFMADCKNMFDEDLMEIVKHNNLTFHYVSREYLDYVDILAKQARTTHLMSFTIRGEADKLERASNKNVGAADMVES